MTSAQDDARITVGANDVRKGDELVLSDRDTTDDAGVDGRTRQTDNMQRERQHLFNPRQSRPSIAPLH